MYKINEEITESFSKIPNQICFNGDLKPVEKAILIFIMAQKPSFTKNQSQIANELGVTRQTFLNGLKRLKDKNYITVETQSYQQWAVYNIDLKKIIDDYDMENPYVDFKAFDGDSSADIGTSSVKQKKVPQEQINSHTAPVRLATDGQKEKMTQFEIPFTEETTLIEADKLIRTNIKEAKDKLWYNGKKITKAEYRKAMNTPVNGGFYDEY